MITIAVRRQRDLFQNSIAQMLQKRMVMIVNRFVCRRSSQDNYELAIG